MGGKISNCLLQQQCEFRSLQGTFLYLTSALVWFSPWKCHKDFLPQLRVSSLRSPGSPVSLTARMVTRTGEQPSRFLSWSCQILPIISGSCWPQDFSDPLWIDKELFLSFLWLSLQDYAPGISGCLRVAHCLDSVLQKAKSIPFLPAGAEAVQGLWISEQLMRMRGGKGARGTLRSGMKTSMARNKQ